MTDECVGAPRARAQQFTEFYKNLGRYNAQDHINPNCQECY